MSRWTRAFRGGARARKDVDAILRSALLAVLDRDLDRAEDLLSKAVSLDANGLESFLALARLFRMRGEIGRAIRIHQSLLLRPDLTPARKVAVLADLAADFRQGGFLRRAIASYEEVVARDSKHQGALRELVRLLAEVREYPRAIEMARKLARAEGEKSAPLEAGLYADMAQAAQAEGRNEDARKAVKRSLRRDRRLVRAWITLGELEAERGRNKAALAAWVRVPQLERRSGPLIYPQLEAAYASLGRARDFEGFLSSLLETQPEDAGTRLALARALAARGEVDSAITELRHVLDRDPDDLEAHATLGRILLSERRDSEGSRALGELLDVLDRRGLLRPPETLE